MKALFLYTELADYTIRCCAELSRRCEVHIVRWPVNKEAPFRFTIPPEIKVYEKEGQDREALLALVRGIGPDIIVCSGWIDKDYLHVAGSFKMQIPVVLALDTRWKGNPRQYLAMLLGRLYLRRIFTHAWVPGEKQAEYARRLGFAESGIRRGFYCCDLHRFNAVYSERIAGVKAHFPHRFIYTGRYYAFKGLKDLWEAFIAVKQEVQSDWELWCLGTGDLQPVEHESVKHFGFVQPADLGALMKQCGVFVLPSRFEPWGVVVQEFAAAGFPLLLSEAVGAREMFLEPGVNGEVFRSANVESLKAALKKIMLLSDKALFLMAERSHALAQRISLEQWAATVTEIRSGFKQN